ncbi:MAG TPA: hypothetical protein VJI97_02695 [Candidatus Nanoarchaeia archaeon]|nr:hypothetical protein [Candidatus Nanoarchaeia archaeon]
MILSEENPNDNNPKSVTGLNGLFLNDLFENAKLSIISPVGDYNISGLYYY